MGIIKPKQKYTFEEYLEIDKKSEFRYEFRNGEIFAMAGSSGNHNSISGNLFSDLLIKMRAKGAKCKAYISDMRVQILSKNSYYYPDVVVSCNEEIRNSPQFLQHPIFIAEVLSDSTANKDRSEKLLNYLQIPSLQYYLIISQDEIAIHLYERTDIGWGVKFFTEITEIIPLIKMDVFISVKDLYEEVYWEENQE